MILIIRKFLDDYLNTEKFLWSNKASDEAVLCLRYQRLTTGVGGTVWAVTDQQVTLERIYCVYDYN